MKLGKPRWKTRVFLKNGLVFQYFTKIGNKFGIFFFNEQVRVILVKLHFMFLKCAIFVFTSKIVFLKCLSLGSPKFFE